MGSKNKLSEMLKARNPLSQPREAVKPINMYTNPQVDKTTSIQVDKEVTPQTDKPVSSEKGKQASGQVVKYTTHLKPETIKAVKQIALDTDRKDYEVLQEAIEDYLKKRGDTP